MLANRILRLADFNDSGTAFVAVEHIRSPTRLAIRTLGVCLDERQRPRGALLKETSRGVSEQLWFLN